MVSVPHMEDSLSNTTILDGDAGTKTENPKKEQNYKINKKITKSRKYKKIQNKKYKNIEKNIENHEIKMMDL